MTSPFKSFYKVAKGKKNEKCFYTTRLDPYGRGCAYNCSYCYGKQLLDFRKLWHPEDIAVAEMDQIEKTIKKIPKGSIVRMGGMTDCFQPIEQKYENTYKTIQLLNDHQIHYLIVTKSDLICTKKYMEILDPKLAHIQISIETDNDYVLRRLSDAPPFYIRKHTLEQLYEAGFDTSLRLSPFLYETADFTRINEINIEKCLIEFLRYKPNMAEHIGKFVDQDQYTVKENGYRHLPLDQKLEVISKLNFPEISLCDSVKEHYLFFKNNINTNPYDCCNLDYTQKEDNNDLT
jgi:DNA repair photolyase